MAFFHEQHGHGEGQHRKNEQTGIERESEERHNPRGERGTHVGAEDDCDGF